MIKLDQPPYLVRQNHNARYVRSDDILSVIVGRGVLLRLKLSCNAHMPLRYLNFAFWSDHMKNRCRGRSLVNGGETQVVTHVNVEADLKGGSGLSMVDWESRTRYH